MAAVALITHPFIMRDFVLVQIVSETPKTLNVRYWHNRNVGWGESTFRRNKDGTNVTILGEESTLDLKAIADRMAAAKAAREDAINAAIRAYMLAMQEVARG